MGGDNSQIVSYKYFLGAHLIICLSTIDELQEIIVGERSAWTGSVTSSQAITINNPDLFGGDRKEGGVSGTVDVEFGEDSQDQNSYLVNKLGSDIPAFRGVLGLILNQCYVCATSPYPKAWAAKVKRCAGRSWYESKCDINGSSNPIHIVYETLTNTNWGMAYSETALDLDSFTSAADTIFDEDFGLSLILSGQEPIENFLQYILSIINGILYTDPSTGKFKIQLIRDDYDVETLQLFDEDNILKLTTFERPQFSEMVNEIVIKYTKQGETIKSSTTIQDLASVLAQGGVVSQTYDYPGIDSDNIANRVGMRELRQNSTPLAKVNFVANRSAWDLVPGGVIKFAWEKLGVESIVLRIVNVKDSGLRNGSINVDCVEDVFGLPSSSYIVEQESEWVDPVSPPLVVSDQRLFELPYWSINLTFPQFVIDTVQDDSAYQQGSGIRPNQASPSYQLWTATPSGDFALETTGAWSGFAELTSNISHTETTDIDIKNINNEVADFTIGNYAYIEDEVVRIDAINVTTEKITIGRGCLDTVAAIHSADSEIFFVEGNDSISITEYLSGETRRGKFLTQTGEGLLDLGSAPISTMTFVGRQFKPYPPGQFRINTLTYPTEITGALTVSWVHRDRLLQLARPMLDESDGSVGPEPDVTYSLNLYNENGILSKQVTGETGTSYIWTTEIADSDLGRLNTEVRVELWSVRDSEDSFQIHDFTFDRVIPPENIVAPVISGIGTVGQTLSSTTGTWDFGVDSYTYQWERDGGPISGATSSTYLLVPADSGTDITCVVTATNIGGSTEATSNIISVT